MIHPPNHHRAGGRGALRRWGVVRGVARRVGRRTLLKGAQALLAVVGIALVVAVALYSFFGLF